MKYYTKILIDLNISEVIALFDNQENMYHWMEGLVSHQHLEGVPGEIGARTKMFFKIGKTEFEMLEIITEKELPHVFAGKYKTDYATNHVKNWFRPQGPDQTLLETETRVEAHSFMIRLMCWFAPGQFKKQSQKYLDNFKDFAENHRN